MPAPRKFLKRLLKICPELPTGTYSSRTPYSSGCIATPKRGSPIPACRMGKTGPNPPRLSLENPKMFCSKKKSLENWLSVAGVMTVFTASDSVCVLQVVCKKSGNIMRSEIYMHFAIYSSQIYRALPTRNIKEIVCQILNMLLSVSPILFPGKKKKYIYISPTLIREQLYSMTGTALGSAKEEHVRLLSSFRFGCRAQKR